MIIDLTFLDIVCILVECAVLFLIILWVVRRIMAQIQFTVNITINPAQSPLAAKQNPLNLTGTVGVPFSEDLASNITGGTPPYTFTASGTPPAGLSISGSVVSGTPNAAGTSTLSVNVTDSGV